LREHWPQLRLTLTADTTQVAELASQALFKLLILDEDLPGRALPELLAGVYRIRPSQRLVVLTDQYAPADEPDRPGVPRRLSRQILPHMLVAALAHWLDAADTPDPRRAHRYAVADSFSRRELEVLRLVVADHCNEDIANQLFINVRTVETHRRNLLHKAGTRTTVGLAARAVREGWVA
jgi:DNA-binding NarL/FixJ family response regulator